MKRRDFIGTAAAGTAAAVLPAIAIGSEEKSSIPGVFTPKDPKAMDELCARINKQHDRACNALNVVGKFSPLEVQVVRKWICKYQERMKFLKRTYPWEGVEHQMSPRDIFLMPDIPSVIPLGTTVVQGGYENRVRIWDAICVSLRTAHDGFDLLAIDTWWEDEA